MRLLVFALCLFSSTLLPFGNEPTQPTDRRAIDDAAIACFTRAGMTRQKTFPGLIVAIWPDGQAIWSNDRLQGGAPYLTGTVEKTKLEAVLSQIEKDGFLSDKVLAGLRYGPDAGYTTMKVKTAKQSLEMGSWHELYEANGKVVATDHGLQGRGDKTKLAVLKEQPAQFLYYRMAWSDLRFLMVSLIPTNGQPVQGQLDFDAGYVFWYPGTKK
jgi:hypothetical protein